LLRDRRALIITLLMPLVTTAVLSFALGADFSNNTIPQFTLAVYNQDSQPAGKALVHVFETLPSLVKVTSFASASAARSAVTRGHASVELEIPSNFTGRLEANHHVAVTIGATPDDNVQSSIIASIIEQFGAQAGNLHFAAQEGMRVQKFPLALPVVQITTQPSGLHPISAGAYYAIGMMVLFLLQTALARSNVILSDRQGDMFKRLCASPGSKARLTVGYLVSIAITLFAQGTLNLICDHYVLGVGFGPLTQTALILGGYAVSLSGIAVMLGSLVNDVGALNGLTGIGGNMAAILGGSMMPIYFFPPLMQDIAHVLPNGQALTALLASIAGTNLSGLYTAFAYLLVAAVVTGLIGRWRQWRPTTPS
ncbi:MAG: ABC transporter permease, partial [Firmicutes bacterium]|nr:ABC transporter permease [Bacillota bacterium]